MAFNSYKFSSELIDYLKFQRDEEAKNYLTGMGRPSRLVDHQGRTLLHYAAEEGNTEMARYFLDSGFSLNHRDYQGHTPLMCAVLRWQFSTCEFLLERAADYDKTRDNHGQTALRFAMNSMWEEIVQMFLDRLQIDYPTNEELARILHESLDSWRPVVLLRNVEVTRLLLEKRRFRDDPCCGNPYDTLFKHGTREMVRLLVQSDRNFVMENMHTLLFHLAGNHNEGAIEEIKGFEYDVNSYDDRGTTVLVHAVKSGHTSAIELLLSEGADVDFVAKFDDETALTRIVVCRLLSPKSKVERLKILLEHGADSQRALPSLVTVSLYHQIFPPKVVYALAKPLLAYVVLRERILRQSVGPKTRSFVEADSRFERYFKVCGTHVDVMETKKIQASVMMLDLLAKDVEWIADRVKNSDLGSELARLCRKLCLNKYYSSKLQRRAKEIVNIVNARREAASVFDDIFGHLYRNNHLIIDKIVSFISCHDLQKTLQAKIESR